MDINNQLKEHIKNYRKLEAEKGERRSNQKGENEAKIKEPKEKMYNSSEGSHHKEKSQRMCKIKAWEILDVLTLRNLVSFN